MLKIESYIPAIYKFKLQRQTDIKKSGCGWCLEPCQVRLLEQPTRRPIPKKIEKKPIRSVVNAGHPTLDVGNVANIDVHNAVGVATALALQRPTPTFFGVAANEMFL